MFLSNFRLGPLMNQQNAFVKSLMRRDFSRSWCDDSILRLGLKIQTGGFVNQFSAFIVHLFLMICQYF